MNGIIRVFPQRTSYTPTDDYAYVGNPPLTIPEHKEVRISCVFSWDKKLADELAYQWEVRTNKTVNIGGPAFGSPADRFEQGMYTRPNIIFTTRGCNNNCLWCMVPNIEGRHREIPIVQGNVVQDNNFLQSSRSHKDKVFEMLKTQKAICFKGGLQPDLIDYHFISGITGLRISELWLACDTDASVSSFKKACANLTKAGFNRNKIRCYCLIGDDMKKNEERLREIYHAGAMPFAQLYQTCSDEKKKYSDDWKKFHRMWSRPAAIKAHMEKGTHYRDFNT